MKKAFTMIELVFVIVVIGILAAAIIPSLKDTKLSEDVIKFIANVRYAQHLSLVYDSFDTSSNWYLKSYCMDLIGTNEIEINRDDGTGTKTPAIDASNSNKTLHVIFTGTTFAITSTKQFTRLCFDHLGRPMADSIQLNSQNLINDKIVLQFTHGSETAIVEIMPETGYTRAIY